MRIDQRLLLFLRSAKEADENGYVSNILSALAIIFGVICTYFMAYLFVTNTSFGDLFTTCQDCTHSISFIVWVLGILIASILGVIILMIVKSVQSYNSGEKFVNTPCGVFFSALLMVIAITIYLCGLAWTNTHSFSEYFPKTSKKNQDIENFVLGFVIACAETLIILFAFIIVQYCIKFWNKTHTIYIDKLAYEQGICKCKRTE